MRDLYPKQKEIINKPDLLFAIQQANSVKALNMLRMSVVKSKSNEVLQEWQRKFWQYKRA